MNITDLKQSSPTTEIVIIEPNQTSDYSNTHAQDFTLVRKELVAKYNLKYIDLPEIIGDYNYFVKNSLMIDSVHPNKEGFKRIAIEIQKEL